MASNQFKADMKHTTQTIQSFPAISIEPLESGHIRLKDMSGFSDDLTIDLHPVQVQALALMVGFEVPDKSRRTLARLTSRLKAIKAQSNELEGTLRLAVFEHDMEMATEMRCAENIAFNLGEMVKDLEDLMTPELEPCPDASSNPGGQLTLPV